MISYCSIILCAVTPHKRLLGIYIIDVNPAIERVKQRMWCDLKPHGTDHDNTNLVDVCWGQGPESTICSKVYKVVWMRNAEGRA